MLLQHYVSSRAKLSMINLLYQIFKEIYLSSEICKGNDDDDDDDETWFSTLLVLWVIYNKQTNLSSLNAVVLYYLFYFREVKKMMEKFNTIILNFEIPHSFISYLSFVIS